MKQFQSNWLINVQWDSQAKILWDMFWPLHVIMEGEAFYHETNRKLAFYRTVGVCMYIRTLGVSFLWILIELAVLSADDRTGLIRAEPSTFHFGLVVAQGLRERSSFMDGGGLPRFRKSRAPKFLPPLTARTPFPCTRIVAPLIQASPPPHP